MTTQDDWQDERTRYRLLLGGLGSMLLVAVLLAVSTTTAYHRERARNAEGRQAQLRQLDRLQRELDVQERAVPPTVLTPADLIALYAKGLREPLREIPADLQQHPELIPWPGVAGGTMRFLSADDIHVLNGRWVLAACEDGHVRGTLLLEYAVSDTGAISWQVLASARE